MFVASCGLKSLDEGSENATVDKNIILGRWDLTVYDIQGVYPSWFEIKEENGDKTCRSMEFMRYHFTRQESNSYTQ